MSSLLSFSLCPLLGWSCARFRWPFLRFLWGLGRSFCLRVRFGLRFWRRLQCPAGNSAELYHYKIVKVENKHAMGPRSAQHMVQAAILLTAIHEQLTKLRFLLYLVHKSCGVILENNLNRWYLADILKNKYHAGFFFPDLLIAKTRMQREQCNDPARTW